MNCEEGGHWEPEVDRGFEEGRTEVLCSEDRERVTYECAWRALLGKRLSTACG